jgi:hypothetical protein
MSYDDSVIENELNSRGDNAPENICAVCEELISESRTICNSRACFETDMM